MTQQVNTRSPHNIADIDDVLALCRDEMRQVDHSIRTHLNSEVVLINQISEYIISNGGKRLRPLLLLLLSKALGYRGEHHITLAATVELIHTATLLHDDVVDESEMRRGNKTSHEIWGNAASVLVGDFLYSKAFQMMVTAESMGVMRVLANATNRIAEGEVQQLLNIGNLATSEADYLRVITNKTAKLFEAGCELAALISDCSATRTQQLADYGRYLGIAFQMADDVLDYSADEKTLGKNLGDDLQEGKLTLPLIHLLAHGTAAERAQITRAIEQPDLDALLAVREAIAGSDALDYTRQQAHKYSAKASECLQSLPDSPATAALHYLANFAVDREA